MQTVHTLIELMREHSVPGVKQYHEAVAFGVLLRCPLLAWQLLLPAIADYKHSTVRRRYSNESTRQSLCSVT